MISKIIALAIALVLLVSAPVYSAVVTPSTPIEFGAGDGTSAVIADTADLNTLIASIPDINAYLGVDKITDVNPDFRTFTMVESGYGKTTQPTRPYKTVINADGEEEYVRVYQEGVTTMSHTLEIAFGLSGVYYTCVGENTTETLIWELFDNSDSRGSNLYSAEKSTTSYAFELYYTKNTILVKYNDFDITNAECGFENINVYDANGPVIPYTNVVLTEEDDGYEEYKLQQATVTALSQCFGKWMRVDIPDENAVPEEPNYEELGQMSEKEQIQYMIDMMVNELVMEYSTTVIQGFTQTHAQNQQYLAGLGAFMLEGAENFMTLGNRHILKENETARDAYLAAVIPNNAQWFKMSEYKSDVYFTTNDKTVDLIQVVNLTGRRDEDTARELTEATATIETLTTFKNVGNTVATMKDTEISTVFDVFKEPFGEMFREMMMEEEAENNG